MAGDGTKVTLSELQAHHGQVDNIMEELNTAVQASGQAGAFNDWAFGIIGQPCAAVMEIWISSARNAMNAVVGAGKDMSQKLKDTHADYSNNEDQCKNLFTSIHKGLS